MDAQYIAQASAAALWAEDKATQGLGATLVSVAPGEAVLRMTVVDSMVNGHGICHGGFIFALAGSAFAFAANSRNQRNVAQTCTITFLAPAKLGDVLIASGREIARVGRTGLCDVAVTREGDGLDIAEFRGQSRTIKGELIASVAP